MTHKLVIFGISGRTGRELTKIAGLKGGEVRGFARSTSTIDGGIGNGTDCAGKF